MAWRVSARHSKAGMEGLDEASIDVVRHGNTRQARRGGARAIRQGKAKQINKGVNNDKNNKYINNNSAAADGGC